MNLWKFIFGKDKPKQKSVNKTPFQRKDTFMTSSGISGNSSQKRKIPLHRDTPRMKFEKKQRPPLHKKEQKFPEKKEFSPKKTVAQTPSNTPKQEPPLTQNKITASSSPQVSSTPAASGPATTEIHPEMNKILLDTVKTIESGIFTSLSDVMIYDKIQNKIVAHYKHDELDLSKLQDVIAKFFKLVEGKSGLEVKNFAIFHFGHYRLGLMFNPRYAIFVLMNADKINEGLALAYIRPRIIQLLQKITMDFK